MRTLMVVGIACLFIIASFGSITTTYAAGAPGGNVSDPVVRAVDIALPSVVRIITVMNSHLIVQIQGKSVTFPQGNSNGYQLGVSGSGTFISSNGDILTADHVVNPPQDQELLQALNNHAAPDVANYINQNGNSGSQVTADQVAQQLNSGQLKSTATFGTPQSEVFLSTSYTGPLSAPDLNSVPASIHATVDKIEKQSAVDQEDVAIIHAPFTDTPSVQLGDSSTVQPQDTLTIIGFPGNGDVNPNNPGDLLTSSINKINVSSIKTAPSGAQVIQVGGNVEQGDSGGPALDDNGTVVGIVSFGIVSPGAPSGTSFLQTSNNARSLVQSLNLNTTPGPFEKLWSQAFTDYASNTPGHWHKAQQEFQQLATNYPQFKAVTPYLNYAQAQAKTEKVNATPTAQQQVKNNSGQTSSSSLPSLRTIPAMVWTIAAIALLVLLVVALFGVIVRQRKKKTTETTPPKGQPASTAANAPAPAPTTPPKVTAPGAPPSYEDAMSAFGAPARNAPSLPPRSQQVQPSQSMPPVSTPSGTFTTARVWPCGHMNRPNARFCSVCGEPAPQPPPGR